MSGSIRVTWVMRGSRQSMSKTGIPPLPAPTCTRCAMDCPSTPDQTRRQGEGETRRQDGRVTEAYSLSFSLSPCLLVSLSLFRLRQRPLARLVPDLIAGQPAPGCLNSEDAGKPGGIPPAGHPCTPL